MPLDPQAQQLLDTLHASGLPPIYTQPVAVARQMVRASYASDDPPEPIQQCDDLIIPGPAGDLKIRIYTPAARGPLPILVYFHGGGWVVNDLDTHDGICRTLANAASCLVTAVEMRRAPEAKFPEPLNDCFAATQWLAAHAPEINGDPERIAVGGDSAGGNLAAAVTLLARDRGGPPLVFQLLIYPVTDYYEPGTPSYHENGTGYTLDRSFMVWAWENYLANTADASHPLAAPLKAPDLTNLPPAFIMTAEYDVLRDEGEMYAQRLSEAGVTVTCQRYAGMMHGFIIRPKVLDQGKQGLLDAAQALRTAFAPGFRSPLTKSK